MLNLFDTWNPLYSDFSTSNPTGQRSFRLLLSVIIPYCVPMWHNTPTHTHWGEDSWSS